MRRILSATFRWLAWKSVTLLLILAVLIASVWIEGELKTAAELGSHRASLVAQAEAIRKRAEELKRSAEDQIRKAESLVRGGRSILAGKQAERQELWDGHFWARKNPLSNVANEIRFLDLEIVALQSVVDAQIRGRESWERGLHALTTQQARDAEQIGKQIAGLDEKLGKAFVWRFRAAIYEQLPIALMVLVGVILTPFGIKVFLYFVVAPWVAGRPPIRVLPSHCGSVRSLPAEGNAGNGGGRMSAVSRAVVLGENLELLIQPEYLQSTSLRAEKQTRWFLNAGIPFSSFLSGMFMLTRVGPAGSEPVVISATRDPLSEIGIIELADGAAFVCQPRSLAGVIQAPDNPVRITRHWRLFSVQSWLTLQLRFLVFHGPGQLVLKGCRGIRIESAGTGRLINQAATLGFSAELDYANTRCETFVAYWTGQADLFNDLFTGESGVYVYEEMPGLKRTTGITGRGVEGFTDGLLKAFGV